MSDQTTETKEPDRLLARVETLVASIRKLKAQLPTVTDAELKARMEKRLGEYQTSLKNIQEYGRETMPKKPAGVKIEVPSDVLNSEKV